MVKKGGAPKSVLQVSSIIISEKLYLCLPKVCFCAAENKGSALQSLSSYPEKREIVVLGSVAILYPAHGAQPDVNVM